MHKVLPVLQTVFEHLASLLGVLITLDEVIDASHTLKEHWRQYRRYLIFIEKNYCGYYRVNE